MKRLLYFLFLFKVLATDPVPLSNINTNDAKIIVNGGLTDGNLSDDIVYCTNVFGKAIQLRPTQTTLVSDKVLGLILGHLGEEPTVKLLNMDAVVSNDDPPYIMDGHHKWAAALTINPDIEVKYIRVELPKDKLITVLNYYTKGKLNIDKGKQSTGESIEVAFKNLEYKIIMAYYNGFTNDKVRYDSDKVKSIMKKVIGANDSSLNGRTILIRNLKNKNIVTTPSTLLSKEDMPVIEKEHIPLLINDLQSGSVDVHQ